MRRSAVVVFLVVCALARPLSAQTPAPPAAPDPQAHAKWHGLYDPNPQVRIEAAQRFATEGTTSAHVGLVELLVRDPDENVRVAAAIAMGLTRNADLRDPLQQAALWDGSIRVRNAAAASAEQLKPYGKLPRVAAGLALIPGVGHLYLGQYGKAALFAGATIGLLSASYALSTSDNDAHPPIGLVLGIAGQNALTYGIFDAYRSARLQRKNEGYEYPVSEERFGTLLAAPFDPEVLASPWVWAGTPVFLTAGLGLVYAVSGDDFRSDRTIFEPGRVNFLGSRFDRGTGFALGSAYFGGLFLPVGLGEEALFRGVLLPALTESFGVGWGLALSSALFGVVHAPNFASGQGYQYKQAAFAIPFISAGGAYMGYVAAKHNYTLARSVAIHFWYDFLLSSVSFMMDPDNQPFTAQFGMPF